MKDTKFIKVGIVVLGVLLILNICIIALFFSPTSYAKVGFEYKIIRLNYDSTQEIQIELNKIGREGWELVAYSWNSNTFIFKRWNNWKIYQPVRSTLKPGKKPNFRSMVVQVQIFSLKLPFLPLSTRKLPM
jgi:hypothetical protein